MKLELKHLAAYLPYELKIYQEDLREHVKPFYWVLGKQTNIKDVLEFQNKPILRPLSDLTKEINHDGIVFTPYDNDELSDAMASNEDLEYLCEQGGSNIAADRGMPYFIIEILLKWHFDVFGLIEKGLAIDINTLNK